MFQKLLIANRGEIALRVIRTAREMGIQTIAVYSEADRKALHVRMADDAWFIGPPPPRESYLRIDRLLEVIQRSGAEAVHPGYGFLAENAEFADAVEKLGVTFVGPPASAIRAMGDKIGCRQLMQAADVPVVPGIAEPLADWQSAREVAQQFGYPVMLKASAGGGGKGIRIVEAEKHLRSAFETASGEATSAFGDGRLYLEKYLRKPRHIEMQVLADHHGDVIHVLERECSIQRRHQKLIEECPSAIVDADLRQRMGDVAVQAARACGYTNAGTIEFLYSGGEFYFLEMNTRLQVEHPVTEMVTGIDLVKEQLRIASGAKLSIRQEDVVPTGHAIEVRVNAEDPDHGWVPSTGKVKNLRLPAGPWVRVDSALHRGMEVGLMYDPMLAKVICWGRDRGAAIERMRRALMEMHVGGVKTSASIALRIIDTPEFRAGDLDTGFFERVPLPSRGDRFVEAAALGTAIHRMQVGQRRSLQGDAEGPTDGLSPWVATHRAGTLGRGGR